VNVGFFAGYRLSDGGNGWLSLDNSRSQSQPVAQLPTREYVLNSLSWSGNSILLGSLLISRGTRVG